MTLLAAPAAAEQGTLQDVRSDVRDGPPAAPPSPPPSGTDASRPQPTTRVDEQQHWQDMFPVQAAEGGIVLVTLYGAFLGVTSPAWGPVIWLHEDNIVDPGYFISYPYSDAETYIKESDCGPDRKPFAVRLDVEYMETFDRLDNLGAHLFVETAVRTAIGASWYNFEERDDNGRRDSLNVGNCNLMYRFAQGDFGEFRTGLGMNWLNDSAATNLGFNFTYAADIYPCKPWVLSAELNWGTLGKAELFTFRSTAGVIFHHVETYAGYEYTDIGREHWSGLIAGLRFWF